LNLGRGKQFSLLQYILTSSGAHPAIYSMGTRVLAWAYSGKGIKVTTLLQPALILKMIITAMTLFLLNAFMVWPVKVTTFFTWQKKSMKLMNSKVYSFITHEVFSLSDKVLWKTFSTFCAKHASNSIIYCELKYITHYSQGRKSAYHENIHVVQTCILKFCLLNCSYVHLLQT